MLDIWEGSEEECWEENELNEVDEEGKEVEDLDLRTNMSQERNGQNNERMRESPRKRMMRNLTGKKRPMIEEEWEEEVDEEETDEAEEWEEDIDEEEDWEEECEG